MRFISSFKTAALLLAVNGLAFAAVTPEEAQQLNTTLTAIGAEKAGNADGSIPAWDGGITSAAQAGITNFKPGHHHPDPYASDKALYTVTAANMGQYAAKLTEGHKKLLQTYKSTFKMNVYPTHRSAAAPQRIYDATKRIATTAQLAPGGTVHALAHVGLDLHDGDFVVAVGASGCAGQASLAVGCSAGFGAPGGRGSRGSELKSPITISGPVVPTRSSTSCSACTEAVVTRPGSHSDSRCVVTNRTVVAARSMSAQA